MSATDDPFLQTLELVRERQREVKALEESAKRWFVFEDVERFQVTPLDFFAAAALEGIASNSLYNAASWDEMVSIAWEAAGKMVSERNARLTELQRAGKAQVGMEGDLPCAQRPEEEPVDPDR